MSKIEKLKRFLTNLDKLDHDADKAIAHISEVDDLDEEKRNANRERDKQRYKHFPKTGMKVDVVTDDNGYWKIAL